MSHDVLGTRRIPRTAKTWIVKIGLWAFLSFSWLRAIKPSRSIIHAGLKPCFSLISNFFFVEREVKLFRRVMKKAYQINIRFAFYVKLFFNVDKSLVSCCVNVNEKFRSMAHFPSFLFLNIIRTFMHMINPFGQFIRIFQKRTRPFRVFCILPGSCIRMSLMIDRNRYLQLQGKFATNLHPRLHFDLSLEQTLSTASFISLKNSGRH